MNQSYNAGVNYSNRNASSNNTKTDIIRGYSGAVFTSLSIIYILINKVFVNVAKNMTGAKQVILTTFSNWVAISMANASN